MPVLKTQCPECDTKLRLTVDGEGAHDIECPKCGHDFTATLDDDEPPVKATKAKKAAKGKSQGDKSGAKAKAAKRRDEDDEDDEDDDRPRKKKKDEDDGGKTKLLVAGIVAGVLALAGLGGIIFAVTYKDKPEKSGDTAAVTPAAQPVSAPAAKPAANPAPTPNAGPKPNPPPVATPNAGSTPNPGSKPPVGPNPAPKPKPADEDAELATFLPPPPKIRVSGSKVPTDKPVVRAPAIPPLAPDEDPFLRAKEFKLDAALPKLPALPPRAQRPMLTLESGGHTDSIEKVFFTPKGDQVITIARDKAVRIWDPATNEAIKTIRFPAGPGKEGSLQAAAISRSGKKLAVAGHPLGGVKDGKVPIYLVTLDGSAPVKSLNVAASAVQSLHFSNDGKWLGVGCEEGEVQVVDLATGRASTSPLKAAGVREVKYNPDTKVKLLAVLEGAGAVKIWNFASGGQPVQFRIVGGTPTGLAWSNDGRTLAAGTTGGVILLCGRDGKLVKTLGPIMHKGKPVPITQFQFLPGDDAFAVAGVSQTDATGWCGIVDSDSGAVRVSLTQHSNVVHSLDVAPDGKRVVTSGGSQHETVVWNVTDAKVVNRFVGAGNAVWAIAWAKDGKSLAWGHSNVFDENQEGKLEHTFRLDEFGLGNPPDSSKYTQMVKSDDKIKVINSSKVFLVQAAGHDPIAMNIPGEQIFGATVLPTQNAVAVAASETLALVKPSTGQVIHKFVGHTGAVLCVTPSPDGKYFATGSSDQTIRIWKREYDEPLLSIFVAGREWIAWTAQGYYACSGQGERLIAWQIGAAGKVPLVHPAERFRASMYQPALLKYVVPTGDLPRALAMAQKYDKALVQTTSVADVLPPEVALEGFGETELKVDKDTLAVKATATSPKHPITAMRLLVNGRPYQGAAGVKRFDNPQKTAEATWDVALTPGTHTIAVIADSLVSKGMSKVGIAVRAGEIPKPNLYVLAVGVSAYPGKLKLNYCATDAEMLAAAFKDKSASLFNVIEVKLLTDKAATKKGILEGLDWLKSKMTPQDVGIVTFSGHGTKDLFGNFYLCPVDLDTNDEDCLTCLSGKLFKERLDNMPGRLVAILDACHSGSVAEKERPAAQTDALVRDLTAEDSGVIVMCASAGRESAIESKLTKAGFYTFGLVEGMSGHGDIDGDGVVYIHELDIYATARARQLSGGKQNPTLGRPATMRPFPIAKVTTPVP